MFLLRREFHGDRLVEKKDRSGEMNKILFVEVIEHFVFSIVLSLIFGMWMTAFFLILILGEFIDLSSISLIRTSFYIFFSYYFLTIFSQEEMEKRENRRWRTLHNNRYYDPYPYRGV